jgi:hypothetical protein
VLVAGENFHGDRMPYSAAVLTGNIVMAVDIGINVLCSAVESAS